MSVAWSILKSNSSLPFGIAWEHLKHQQGGGVILVENLGVDADTQNIDVNVDTFSNIGVGILVADIEITIDLQDIDINAADINEGITIT